MVRKKFSQGVAIGLDYIGLSARKYIFFVFVRAGLKPALTTTITERPRLQTRGKKGNNLTE
ncbi:MAG: hypothetical protein FWD66_10910 [Paludibacter sp.]|nr:hypothetical protein [Paludibacter sp.]